MRRHGTLYKNNNVHLIINSDGLDPEFGRLDEIMVLGGDSVIYVLSLCKVLFLLIMPSTLLQKDDHHISGNFSHN